MLIYNPALIPASKLHYWYRMRAEIGAGHTRARIAHLAPGDPGYVIDVSGAAVLKSSAHRAAAQKFLAFLVSKQGQSIIADPSKSISYEYPIDSGVTTRAGTRHADPTENARPMPPTGWVGELRSVRSPVPGR